ncbi:MAG TPA: exodeoxyribonuclease VII large subunit [Longimicrobium sp.]|nr:exodeoxyribonuclease VII large subunit [Longimicrobium sp.]
MWDLFTSAEFEKRESEPKKEPPAEKAAPPAAVPELFERAPEKKKRRARATELNEARNEDVARTVAAREAETGARTLMRVPAEGMTVAEVNSAARELIEGVFPPLWVHGEVANFTRAKSGHCYFSLRDADAQIRCVMWRDDARRLPTLPEDGMKVRALGRLTLYEQRGEFQLGCFELEAKGEGLYKLAYDRLKARLDQEGLTAPDRKRPIPAHPACVGVVTSSSGAALRDIVSVIRRRAPWTRIVLASAKVQGEGAPQEIASAIRLLGRAACADVLIVGRGGGSIEDLWAFNEEVVARAIADSPVPVISAVGHETDFTIADLVADLRAPTPSAAAEAAVPDQGAVRRRLADLRERLVSCTRDRVADGREAVFNARLDLKAAAERGLRARREGLGARAARLQALSPLNVLARGYAVPLDDSGRVLRRAADFAPGDAFRLRVADGTVPCRVDEPTEGR